MTMTMVQGSSGERGATAPRADHPAVLLGDVQGNTGRVRAGHGRNPSEFSATGKEKDKVAGEDTKRFPVENVSWDDAVEFC